MNSAGGYARDADKGGAAGGVANGAVKTTSKFLVFKSKLKPGPGSRVFVLVKPPTEGTPWGTIVRHVVSVEMMTTTLIIAVNR